MCLCSATRPGLQEGRNLQDFGANFAGDALVKIPWVRTDLSGPKVLVMEWVDGIRCGAGAVRCGAVRCGAVGSWRASWHVGDLCG